MDQLRYSSVPAWAVSDLSGTTRPDSDPAHLAGREDTASEHLLVGVGPAAAEVLSQIGSRGGAIPTTRILVTENDRAGGGQLDTTPAERAAAAMSGHLRAASVGVRITIAGSASDCLLLRARAIADGAEDDEVSVIAVDWGTVTVFCAHCRAVTAARARIGEVITCAGCGREVVVYHHVSRRTGFHLGYMIDAERSGQHPVRSDSGVPS